MLQTEPLCLARPVESHLALSIHPKVDKIDHTFVNVKPASRLKKMEFLVIAIFNMFIFKHVTQTCIVKELGLEITR